MNKKLHRDLGNLCFPKSGQCGAKTRCAQLMRDEAICIVVGNRCPTLHFDSAFCVCKKWKGSVLDYVRDGRRQFGVPTSEIGVKVDDLMKVEGYPLESGYIFAGSKGGRCQTTS